MKAKFKKCDRKSELWTFDFNLKSSIFENSPKNSKFHLKHILTSKSKYQINQKISSTFIFFWSVKIAFLSSLQLTREHLLLHTISRFSNEKNAIKTAKFSSHISTVFCDLLEKKPNKKYFLVKFFQHAKNQFFSNESYISFPFLFFYLRSLIHTQNKCILKICKKQKHTKMLYYC